MGRLPETHLPAEQAFISSLYNKLGRYRSGGSNGAGPHLEARFAVWQSLATHQEGTQHRTQSLSQLGQGLLLSVMTALSTLHKNMLTYFPGRRWGNSRHSNLSVCSHLCPMFQQPCLTFRQYKILALSGLSRRILEYTARKIVILMTGLVASSASKAAKSNCGTPPI